MIKLLRRLKNWLVYGPRIDLPPPPGHNPSEGKAS